MEPNRNPENFFAEVEQTAFNPANVVPGIGFSPDKMLQSRLFSYGDAPREIQIRHIGNCLKADPAYGNGIADAFKITLSDVPA